MTIRAISIIIILCLLTTSSCLRKEMTVKSDLSKTDNHATNLSDNYLINEIETAGNIPKDSIFEAAKLGDIDKLKDLLSKNPEIVNNKHFHDYQRTALHYAVIFQQKEAVRLLIDKGATINNSDMDYGMVPLHYVAINGNTGIADLLLSKGAELDVDDNFGWTPLHKAVLYNRTKMIEFLLNKGSNVDIDDETGRTPLHNAVIQGNKLIVNLLLSYGANINSTDNEGRSSLHHAIKWEVDNSLVELLLAHGADVNLEDNEGKTPLREAEIIKNDKLIDLLKSKGAKIVKTNNNNLIDENFVSNEFVTEKNINKKNNDNDIMNYECNNMITEILQKKTIEDINKHDNAGLTMLHRAIMNANINAAENLITKGADVNIGDISGKTPLHYCTIYDLRDMDDQFYREGVLLEFAKKLILSGAEINKVDNEGRTPLHYVRNRRMTELLILYNADLNIKDKDGWTPLHWAVMRGFKSVVWTLVENQADIELKDKDGNTPLDIATMEWIKNEGHSEISIFLREHHKHKLLKLID